jgi:peptidoglycan hydrolase-like protein with peptidoglycan-binding domain
MGSYSLLMRGDKTPTVAILQKLLNRAGASLTVDADFGLKTQQAMFAFQSDRGLTVDGAVDADDWARLIHNDVLPIVDCIDVFDEVLYNSQAKAVVDSGGNPLMVGGMSNGLQQVATSIGSARLIFLLRFIGHGCAGVQGVSIGRGGWIEQNGPHGKPLVHFFGDERSKFKVKETGRVDALGLKQIFGPLSSVEMHGCHVASGAVGHKFIGDMAKTLGVPVTAGVLSQRSALRFDGPTFTAYPSGKDSWCASLPDFAPISVP